ncbi:hypothetical protein FRB98_005787 [Tulasnella sp. 332]|nr:hypothetical protein FRB98_005787 [Tulasnella sp. 332]
MSAQLDVSAPLSLQADIFADANLPVARVYSVGTAIVADYCFWLSARVTGSKESEEKLMAVLRMGIEAYQRNRQEEVVEAIHSMVADGKTKGVVEVALKHRLPKPKAIVVN